MKRSVSLKKIVDKGIDLFLWFCGIVVLWLLAQVFLCDLVPYSK